MHGERREGEEAGGRGLRATSVMDFRAQQRGPLIYYTSAPAGDWKGAFYDCEGGSIAN